MSIGYQYIHIDGYEATFGKLDLGTTDTHILNFDVSFAVTDRWSVSLGIPLVRKRYHGPLPHDPDSIIPPADQENIDDGKFRTDFQDFHLGVNYRAWENANFSFSPFISYGTPSHDYPFFGNAAIGQNLWKLELGFDLVYVPTFSYWYFRFAPSYEFVEETLGVNINNVRVNAAAGYFVTDRVSLNAFVLAKQGKGLDFPEDFPPPRNDEFWFNHDRMARHNYVNLGLGLEWQVDPMYHVSLSWMTMVHAEQTHIMQDTITMGLSKAF
ncbi:transporter [Parahaliea maris]|uniref:Transporter n=2 Tax=Parahaliea maris TaxID=2716870 RepID=A0A5C8ZZG4_9GAMM|nr:transporter [Parahaliea maris]